MNRYAWGNSPELEAQRLEITGPIGEVHGEPIVLQRPDVTAIAHADYKAKLEEIRDNLQIVGDPSSSSRGGVTAELTVANADALSDGKGVVLHVSTSGSTLVENPSNGVELADNALLNPDYAFIYMASPGNGGTSGLTGEELETAKRTGLLVDGSPGWFFEATPTLQGLARALGTVAPVTHVSADDTGAHIAPAILAGMPQNQAQAAFLYNPKNLRDMSRLTYSAGMLKAMTMENWLYAIASGDPLKVDGTRREEAKKVFGEDFKHAVERKRASAGTFNPGKMRDEMEIFRRGPETDGGNAAVKHAMAALERHEGLEITYGLPTHGVNYPGAEGARRFLLDIYGGRPKRLERGEDSMRIEAATAVDSVQVLEVPLGHYGHSKFPLARLAMQSYAFTT